MADQSENLRVVLRSRPGVSNPPSEENFGVEKAGPLDCKDGDILVKTLYLSVDPYMRTRMNEGQAVGYIPPWDIGHVCTGGAVGIVEESKTDKFSVGEMIETFGYPWQQYCTLSQDHPGLRKLESDVLRKHPSLALGLCGLTGLSSLVGLQEKGHIVDGGNQTVFVSGASGACGVAAGQISKLLGSGRVLGTCGTDEKCSYIKELGFDGAINYKTTQNMAEDLKRHCPDGIDVYFDNVGGETSNEVIRIMNKDSHVVVCGQISQYNKDIPYPTPLPDDVQQIVAERNITRERFLILNYTPQWPAARTQLETWIEQGKLRSRETIEEGIENAGKAFVSMMTGGNVGKQVVKIN